MTLDVMATDREKSGFNGPVHTVRTEIELSPSRSYKVNPGGLELLEIFTSEYDGQRNLYELFVFDESGRLLEEASFDNLSDQESFRFVYTYDDAGRVIQRDEYDQSGSTDGKSLYLYDSEGRKVEEVYYSARGQGTRYTKFDERENPVEMIWYGPDGAVISKDAWEYNYNASDTMIEKICSHRSELHRVPPGYALLGLSEGQPVEQYANKQEYSEKHRRVTIYDNTGNVIEKVEYDPDGSVYCREIFNANGEVIERDFIRCKSVYSYNNQGQLVEMIQTELGEYNWSPPINKKCTHRYDSRGSLIELVISDADGTLDNRETYEYEYDSYDNWVKKTEVRWSYKWKTDPEQIAFEWRKVSYRTITYY